MLHSSAALPHFFCWTKFGAEAGQTVQQILRRKEEERRRNEGVFLWGIGNSVGGAINELVHRASHPKVLFSPIKTTPRNCDSDPQEVLAWQSAETTAGNEYVLPPWSLVTSRKDSARLKACHYALVCYSAHPLNVTPGLGPTLDTACLRNLTTGNRLGASQVTAVVERVEESVGNRQPYPIALRAALIAPFFVKLRNPVAIERRVGEYGWADAVAAFWSRIDQQSTIED